MSAPDWIAMVADLMAAPAPNGCQACRTERIENSFPHSYRVEAIGHTCGKPDPLPARAKEDGRHG